MIIYRVHESALCHESIDGADMIPVVRADVASDLIAALKTLLLTAEGVAFADDAFGADIDAYNQSRAHASMAIAKAEGE